jgi:L-asparaginase
MHHITLISTGGTIEKTYDERSGTLTNARSIVPRMLAHLKLVETTINTVQLLSKDSLDLTDADRDRIADTVAVLGAAEDCDGIVILHGTDTLATTGEMLHARFDPPPVPVVLTGAMRPYEMKRSDALQNLNEALFATGVVSPGVYAVMHGRALKFPGVVKDYDLGTFVRADDDGADKERS